MAGVVSRIRQRAKKLDQPIITFHPELSEAEIRKWYADPNTWIQRKPAVCIWMNAEVGPTGEVEPCYGISAGNVLEEPLSKMWNGAQLRKFRRRLSADEDFPICARCCAFFRRD
jgi:MoaA/NifB/PqqE/SkfB family radical SAM enzyme